MISFTFEGLLLSLLLTAAIYSLPIIIYRYAIKREPIEKAKAKRITIIYGVCAFLVMSALVYAINRRGAAGGAILLWSFLNYHILSREKNVDEMASDNNTETTIMPCEETDALACVDTVHVEAGAPNMNEQANSYGTNNTETRELIKNAPIAEHASLNVKNTLRRFQIIAIVFCMLAVASMVATGLLIVNNQKLTIQIAELDSQIVELNSQNNKLINDIAKLKNQNHELSASNSQLYREHESLKGDTVRLRDALSFYKEYACIYTDERGLYHSYGCNALDTSDGFWIGNPGALPSKCAPCPNCFPYEYSDNDPGWFEEWHFNRYDFWQK